jgi:hypothetical protein
VIRLRVPPALLKTVNDRFETGAVAIETSLDAIEHLLAEVVSCRVGHDGGSLLHIEHAREMAR